MSVNDTLVVFSKNDEQLVGLPFHKMEVRGQPDGSVRIGGFHVSHERFVMMTYGDSHVKDYQQSIWMKQLSCTPSTPYHVMCTATTDNTHVVAWSVEVNLHELDHAMDTNRCAPGQHLVMRLLQPLSRITRFVVSERTSSKNLHETPFWVDRSFRPDVVQRLLHYENLVSAEPSNTLPASRYKHDIQHMSIVPADVSHTEVNATIVCHPKHADIRSSIVHLLNQELDKPDKFSSTGWDCHLIKTKSCLIVCEDVDSIKLWAQSLQQCFQQGRHPFVVETIRGLHDLKKLTIARVERADIVLCTVGVLHKWTPAFDDLCTSFGIHGNRLEPSSIAAVTMHAYQPHNIHQAQLPLQCYFWTRVFFPEYALSGSLPVGSVLTLLTESYNVCEQSTNLYTCIAEPCAYPFTIDIVTVRLADLYPGSLPSFHFVPVSTTPLPHTFQPPYNESSLEQYVSRSLFPRHLPGLYQDDYINLTHCNLKELMYFATVDVYAHHTEEGQESSSREYMYLQEQLLFALAEHPTCTICMDARSVVITSCGHLYCQECICSSARIQSRCPICRTDLHVAYDVEELHDNIDSPRLEALKKARPDVVFCEFPAVASMIHDVMPSTAVVSNMDELQQRLCAKQPCAVTFPHLLSRKSIGELLKLFAIGDDVLHNKSLTWLVDPSQPFEGALVDWFENSMGVRVLDRRASGEEPIIEPVLQAQTA